MGRRTCKACEEHVPLPLDRPADRHLRRRWWIGATAIGCETAGGGAARFDRDVLAPHPDVITIDYALNDRLGFTAD